MAGLRVVSSFPPWRSIGRGTVVRFRSSSGYNRTGIVVKVLPFSVDNIEHHEEQYAEVIFPSARPGGSISVGRTHRPFCTSYTLRVSYLEPVGEVKRMPRCKDGYWVLPSARKHRVRETEVGKAIESLQNSLGDPVFEMHRGFETKSKLVRLDQKVAGLARGPRRKKGRY